MRLRKECEHGLYDTHLYELNAPPPTPAEWFCLGGEFLPESLVDCDALAQALTASEGIFHQDEGWAELNDHGIRVL